MKSIKLFLSIVIILFIAIINFSCSSKIKTTTYQIINNKPYVLNIGDQYYNNTLFDVRVDCYIGSSIVRIDSTSRITSGGVKYPPKEIDAAIEKIKISYKNLPPADPAYNYHNPRIYFSGFFTIKENTNNVIIITENTPIDSK